MRQPDLLLQFVRVDILATVEREVRLGLLLGQQYAVPRTPGLVQVEPRQKPLAGIRPLAQNGPTVPDVEGQVTHVRGRERVHQPQVLDLPGSQPPQDVNVRL